jgi:hypothetical protein
MLLTVQRVAVDALVMNSDALVVSGQNPTYPVQSYLYPRLWHSQQPRRLKKFPV